MRTDINACDYIRGYTDTVRESALKVDSREKIPCRNRGIEPASATCRSDASPTEIYPHPLWNMAASFLADFYPYGPFTCIFFQNLSRVFPVFAVANAGFCVGPQNKIGHPEVTLRSP